MVTTIENMGALANLFTPETWGRGEGSDGETETLQSTETCARRRLLASTNCELQLFIRPEPRTTCVDVEAVLKDVEAFEQQLHDADEEHLAFLWRVRKDVDSKKRFKLRQMIWDECERRYEHVVRAPIVVRLPYFQQLDGQKVKAQITALI